MSNRYVSLDVARGLIMMIMALDHAAVGWNSGRPLPELGLEGFPVVEYSTIGQQITREITHICAPGFQLLAGAGLAVSVLRRQRSKASELAISGDMVLRGAVLFFCEWVLLYYAMDRIFLPFVVLSCIGTSMIVYAAARFLPIAVIAAGSLCILFTAPLYAPDSLAAPLAAGYLRNVLTNIALGDEPAWFVLYPVVPWIGFFGVGWSLGTLYERRSNFPSHWLIAAGVACFTLAVGLRWFGGTFGERMPGAELGPLAAQFWVLAKYPPTPPFSFMTLGALAILIGLLRPLDATEPHPAWKIPLVFGRVALFFYIAHLYLYLAFPVLTDTVREYGLPVTYAVWLAGLAVLWPLCWGYGKLREKYATVLRYF